MATADIAAVVNGGAPRLDRELVEVLEGELDAVCCSATEGEAAAFLRDAVAGGARAIIVGGGDGTIAHALTSVWLAVDRDADLLPTIGFLRLGTGNAVADAFEAPVANAHTALGLVAELGRRALGEPLRTIRVGDRLGCFGGFGVDAQLLEDHERSNRWLSRLGLGALTRGALGYVLSTATRSLPRFVGGRRATVTAINRGENARAVEGRRAGDALIEAGTTLWSGACTLASCATIPTFGFGLRMFPLAEVDRDRFQLRASDAGLLEILLNTRAAFRGEYYGPRVHDFLCDRVELRASRPTPFELSGDLIGSRDAVEVSSGPTFELLV